VQAPADLGVLQLAQVAVEVEDEVVELGLARGRCPLQIGVQ
jgi:hypothetical protein